MATHYHARDRTVLKNSRDGLQKENLHTKESVSVSRKEKDILLKADAERTDLSDGNVGRAFGTSNRKPPIFIDGTGERNPSFPAGKQVLPSDGQMGQEVEQGFEEVGYRDNRCTDSIADKNSISGDLEVSENRYRSNEDPGRRLSYQKKRMLRNHGHFEYLREGSNRPKYNEVEITSSHSQLVEEGNTGASIRIVDSENESSQADGDVETVESRSQPGSIKYDGDHSSPIYSSERSSQSPSVSAEEVTTQYLPPDDTDTNYHYPSIDKEDERYFGSVKSEGFIGIPQIGSAESASRHARRRNQYYGKSYTKYQSQHQAQRQTQSQFQRHNQNQTQNQIHHLSQSQSQNHHQYQSQSKYQSRQQSSNRNKAVSSNQAQDKPYSRFSRLSFTDEESRSKGKSGESAFRLYLAGRTIEAASNSLSSYGDDGRNSDDISERIIAGGTSAIRDVSMRSWQMITDRFSVRSIREKFHFGQAPNLSTGSSGKAEKTRQKAIQKKRYQRQYQQAKRTAGLFGDTPLQSTVKTAAREPAKGAVHKAAEAVISGKKSIAVLAAAFIFVIIMAMSTFSGCVATVGGMASVLSTTYPGTDEDILGVDAAYMELEEKLDRQVNEMESTHPDYDEYRYQVDEITHDPFQLASILSAKFGNYTLYDVRGELPVILNLQYTLNVTEEVETRTRTVTDPDTGEETEEEYDYYILNIELTNHGLDYVAGEYLTDDQKSLYEAYAATHGNRDNLFNEDSITPSPGGGAAGITDYEIPPEALSDRRFRNMISEAEKYLGFPYVWGGSSPSTSFDCSGFVAWVINNCGNGWSIGRPSAEGIRQMCRPVRSEDARPGDLIFFQGTYATPGASHIGIYVGNGMMIHCGKPIQYTNINTPYWQQHFYMFGRMS